FPLARGRWRALAAALGGFALLWLAAVLVAGLPAHAVYLAQVAPALAASTAWVENQSLPGFVHRLLAPAQLALRPASQPAAGLVALGAALALLALTAWMTRRGGGMREDLALGLWIIAALLAAPVTWASEYALLLVPLFQALALAGRWHVGALAPWHVPDRDQRRVAPTHLGDVQTFERSNLQLLPWPAAACYTLGLALVAWADPRALYDGELRGPFWQLALSAPLYGALLLYAALALAGRWAVAASTVPEARSDHREDAVARISGPLRG
ncbi:MAG TPA: glycosyltransferase 87 family protein, partial [Roseiflexaceae bacterium]|nr:glycosyltransferase 87 family protein [Roseiflexaceae bacterium]